MKLLPVSVLLKPSTAAVEAELLASLASTARALLTAAAALAKLVKSGAGLTVRVRYWPNCQGEVLA